MGKKGKKKQGIGKAKTEAKAAKKAQKAAKKARETDGEDVEAILAEILAKEAEAVKVAELQDVEPPSPRASFTLVSNPRDENELIFFGGERFTGDRAEFFSDLYVYNVQKNIWNRYDSPNRPPPRSSHAVAVHKNMMYIFGGEFSNPSLTQYRHYRDLWRLDLEDMSWERIELRGGPSGRSGHRMCVANNRLIVFGGFFDTGFENKYLNDLYYIDLNRDELKWTKVETSAVDIVPPRRSGFQWVVNGTEVVLYGGYCKEALKKAKTVSHKGKKKGGAAVEEAMVAQGVMLSDMYKLSAENMKWSKMKRSGYGPTRRAGFSMVLHKSNAVVFGGVEDDETEENMASIFHNDLFALNLDKKKWYPMTLRRRKAKKGRRRKGRGNEAEMDEESSSDAGPTADVDAKMVDINGPKVQDDDDEEKELDTETLEAALISEQVELIPCPRFNAAVAIQKNVMYIVGGVVEKEQQEITLDDIWAVDLNKLEEYREVKALSPGCLEWMESDDDGEEEVDVDNYDDNESRPENVDMEDEEGEEEKQRRRGGRRDRLRARVQSTENENFTPRINESLKDFFERTKSYWIGEVHEALGESGKVLRRIAFEWAFRRYWEIKPTLKELEEIEAQIAREEVLEKEFQKVQLEQKRVRGRR
ncbi:unnamed protein product [Agarophyton chilense]|eukprot:gb/GEZJ01003310.1/.p2 GENE.gb/GEZJ01003310.1/~~gb/GEZJ01003310.1/.p2  ORF type:complete len:645 (-),score=132.99 gb/GEZJ01003310.1/:5725-7659(-)